MTISVLDINLRVDDRTLCMRWRERSVAARQEGVPDPSSARVYFIGVVGDAPEMLKDLRTGLAWLRDGLSCEACVAALARQETELGSMACYANDAGLIVGSPVERARCVQAFNLDLTTDDLIVRWTSSSRLRCFGELFRIWDMGGRLCELEIDPCTGEVFVLNQWEIDAY